MKKRMKLQIFEDGGAGSGSAGGQGGSAGAGNGSQNGNAGGASGAHVTGTYTYEQAEEIANARANKAERTALADFFRKQGMTEEEVTQAIHDFREQKAKRQPNTEQMQHDLDEALKENARMKNEKILAEKGVRSEDLDYVMFKVEKMVDDKTDFKKAAEKYLKENPRFAGSGRGTGTYRVSTGSQSSGTGGEGSSNDSINAAIRRAAGRQV
mgnify:FL=1